jgi:hypothetical protein
MLGIEVSKSCVTNTHFVKLRDEESDYAFQQQFNSSLIASIMNANACKIVLLLW